MHYFFVRQIYYKRGDMFLDFASVPLITLIVYWCVELVKQLTNNNENFKRFIPIFSTLLGILIAVLIYFAFPSLKIAENILYAIGVGGVSGLAATGSNQIFKQLYKYREAKSTFPVKDEKDEKMSSEKEKTNKNISQKK